MEIITLLPVAPPIQNLARNLCHLDVNELSKLVQNAKPFDYHSGENFSFFQKEKLF